MDVVFAACCGIDVHQKSVVACVRVIEVADRVRKEVRSFATTTASLGELARWLQACAVTHVAMESTGVFWKPVWHALERSATLLLVNPRDVAQVPGRKTDVSDAEWIAQLLQCGLLRGSFVPPRPIRELRDLTRSRTTLEQQRTAVVNRLHKALDDARVKLGTVVTDTTGVSGRAILQALIDGQTDATALAKGRLRAIIAMAHSLLVSVYCILRDRVTYQDLGATHFDRLAPEQLTRPIFQRIRRADHAVHADRAKDKDQATSRNGPAPSAQRPEPRAQSLEPRA